MGVLDRHSAAYETLREFIESRMRMSHIYQPAMLVALLDFRGRASVTQIAKTILGYDQSQIEYYQQITKNMVGKVLTEKNQIAEKIKRGTRVEGYALPHFQELSAGEVEQLRTLCIAKIEDYVAQRGGQVWSHRRRSSGYISGTVRYEVLKRAKFRCELCGISAANKALEVDHIIPRNHGGKDELSNFQALCFSCNAMKRDRDDTDFRGIAGSYAERQKGCLFCEIETDRPVVAENELCYAIRDGFPVTDLHALIIPKRHVSDLFDLHQPELNAIYALLRNVKDDIQSFDPTATSFNVGVNAGAEAGQTIFHCHVHLIPRRKGDAEDPRGGVRGVIPGKRAY
jgi:diadenosine tetraphosphate (Ap4A) HIT family hydrolase